MARDLLAVTQWRWATDNMLPKCPAEAEGVVGRQRAANRKTMSINTDSILDFDIADLNARQKREVAERLFGPPKQRALAEALKAAYREQSVQELWAVYEGREMPTKRPDARPYRYAQESLRVLAQRKGLPRAVCTVTAFSRWVHSLYGFGQGTTAAMKYGKYIERSVAKLARPPSHPDWELIYRDPLDGKPPAKVISALMLNGRPLWGAPDLVFRHRRTREVVIIERKASEKEIPFDGWPDMRAQLWCYAQIDEWLDAPAIRLIGEVWLQQERRLYRRTGGTLSWNRGEQPFDQDSAELFSLYKAGVEAAP